MDLVTVNANKPLLQVFRNEVAAGRGFVALRLTGGNTAPTASTEWSPRQATGAVVTVQVGDRALLRELRAGEGLAAQSSDTLIVGLGTAAQADRITVRWPSGKVSQVEAVPSGTLVRAWERPEAGPGGQAFTQQPYGPPLPLRQPGFAGPTFPMALGPAPLTLVTSMATWCEACVAELPDLRTFAAELAGAGLTMVGIPVDPADSSDALQAWVADHDPPWTLSDPGPEQRARLGEFLTAQAGREAVPSWTLLDGDRRVLASGIGTPSRSALQRAAAALR